MRELLQQHRKDGNAYPLIGGHRGCECKYPENSIEAMAEGISQGADYLEIDVQLTKDHVPIIFHDIDTMAKTGLAGLVQDYTFDQLKERGNIPTLLEAMTWGKDNNVHFALEIKSLTCKTRESNLRLMEPLSQVLVDTCMMHNVDVFGIDHQVLKQLKHINPMVDIGLIVPHIPADPIALMREMDALVYLSYAFNLTQASVSLLQDAGYFVSGAILRDQWLIDYAVGIRVDMFEHDHPALVARK